MTIRRAAFHMSTAALLLAGTLNIVLRDGYQLGGDNGALAQNFKLVSWRAIRGAMKLK